MKIKNVLTSAFVLSFILHVSSILVLKFLDVNSFKSNSGEKVVEITILDADSETFKAMQIVEQDQKPVNNELDPNAKYLSQFNQKVVKETRAAKTEAFKNTGGKGITQGQNAKPVENKFTAQPQNKGEGGFKLDKFKPQVDWAAMAEKNVGGDGRDVSSTTDYLKDHEKGPQTTLSTREFLYYTYFKRIKSQIQQYWEPNIKKKIAKIMKSGRKIASEDRITKLVIILNEEGNLTRVQVIHDSGITDLDDAAIEAFKSAAPFPNPPTGLIESDGTVKIRWDFVLEA